MRQYFVQVSPGRQLGWATVLLIAGAFLGALTDVAWLTLWHEFSHAHQRPLTAAEFRNAVLTVVFAPLGLVVCWWLAWRAFANAGRQMVARGSIVFGRGRG